MQRIAIFASGNGSNAENIIKYFEKSTDMSVALVLSNKSEAGVLERAETLGVQSIVFSSAQLREKGFILGKLREHTIDFVVLAGFLLKIPDELTAHFPDKIVNIHPALLPKYGGKGMYGNKVHQAVIENNEKESGITIHFVNEKYDEGKIIFQASCKVSPDDSPESLAKKIHQLEHLHFPRVIESLIKSR